MKAATWVGVLATAALLLGGETVAQIRYAVGQNIVPVFEGWERNPDGSFNMVFGYMNRNYEEPLDIAVGADNHLEPGDVDQGQPTHFYPRRQQFVFKVRVPKDWGKKDLVWTIVCRGKTEKAYATLMPVWELDTGVYQENRGGQGELGDYDDPPTAKLVGDATRKAAVGDRLTLAVAVTDDGKPVPRGRGGQPQRDSDGAIIAPARGAGAGPAGPRRESPLTQAVVKLDPPMHLGVVWIVYRGDARQVSFEPMKVAVVDGRATTAARFAAPGTYVLRGYADDTIYPVPVDVTVTVTAAQPPTTASPTAAAPAAAPAAAASGLDYEFFKTNVQPIFLKKRPGHARCIVCHETGNPRLQPLPEGATMWDEAASRKNFESWQRVVVPGDPMASRLLMHPLAHEAGGDPFHAGGKHWTSQDDPEWQTLVAWVKTAKPAGAARPTTTALDFNVYRTQIEPVFLKPRQPDEGAGAACASCHTKIATRMRLQPFAAGTQAWTEEQSHQNFDVVSRLVVPGDPLKSALLLHPLAQSAGGDAAHTGGKFWASQDNPEWQMIAAWVKAASGAASGAAPAPAAASASTLDFAYFRDRVQPIFLKKRPGHARCIVCHETGNPRLQPLPEGATMWDEAASRKNFEAWQRVVAPGDVTASRLLMHPLAHEAGGDPFHAGGKHWTSQDDPEWQTLAAWVKGANERTGSK